MREYSSILLALVWGLGTVALAQDATETGAGDALAVERAVRAFIGAIDRLDLEGVAACFADDATAFYPFAFTPHRLEGREAIKEAQRIAFEWARENLAGPGGEAPTSLGLTPTGLEVRMLGSEAAAVTWHSNRPNRAGRRSAVLHRVDGRWLIVEHHASNMNALAPPASTSGGG